ncbi:MAG: nitric oxide reductase activation protein NorD [Chthoniobacterales bacterium]
MLEWEEHTFLGLKSLYERFIIRPQEKAIAAVRVSLAPHRQRLFLLAQMAAQRAVTLFETEEAVLCDGQRIFLPTDFALADSRDANLSFYEIKTLLGGLAIRENWVKDRPLSAYLPEIKKSFQGLPEVIERTMHDFETPEEFWATLGEIRPSEKEEAITESVFKTGESPEEKDETQITEIEGRGQLDVKVEMDREDDGIGHEMPIHTFEKAETLEEHGDLSRRGDDEDELVDHQEALRQVKMTSVLRTRERPKSIYRADVLLESLAFEADDSARAGGIPYPEWDFKKSRYREDWCRVHEGVIESADPDWTAETLRERHRLIFDLKKSMARLANESLRAKRQPIGPEFDIDALVENRVAWRSGHVPNENIYLEKKRELHDVATLVLLDRSYSTDAYINGKRVLDLIRETMLCTGEVLDEFFEDFAVASFSSDTRHHCTFDWVKSFDDSWTKNRALLGGILAAGYTRIGPALRHAHELLLRRAASRKVVILITDGRPCDYDRYEGTYGIHDVKRAIITGKANGIDTHAFAIENRARETFQAMFKHDHYHIVPNTEALTSSLCELFAKLKMK